MKRHAAIAILAGALGILGNNGGANAQDVGQYLGEVRLFAFNWCPVNWLQASGQVLPIAQNAALFSLLGTSFGGNGVSTFGLPNLAGSAPYGQLANGQGQPIGAVYGQSQVTLTVANLPAHTHQLKGSSAAANTYSLNGSLLSTSTNTASKEYAGPGSPADAPMAVTAIGMTGNNIPFSIQSPALSMNWCIATIGIYPSRP